MILIMIVLYIFILIYPCYISILLYRLYSTILCILLSCCFIYPGIFIPAYILLCTFMMIHRHEHIYYIHLPMLSMLSSGTCFQLSIPFIASMLLYFYMIHIAFVSWPGFSAFLCHTRMKAHTRIYYIIFIYAFMSHDGTIFLSHYTNYLIVFVLSRDIFYLCSIYTAKIMEFVQ